MVRRHFGPIAEINGLPLRERRSGVHEITGHKFGLRIRYGQGHRNDFLITVFPLRTPPHDLDDLSDEIGLGIVAEFNGVPFHGMEVRNEDDAEKAFAVAAESSKSLVVPYLIGEKDEFAGLRQFVEEKIRQSGVREKKYKFPRNVREEWI
jgi:hypothetical protein